MALSEKLNKKTEIIDTSKDVIAAAPSLAYDESSIQSHERLDIIRGRPSGVLRDLEIMGQTHMAQEVIDNSFDEGVLNPNSKVVICLCRDHQRETYQLIIKDNGRGIPFGRHPVTGAYTLVDLVTKPHSSGKFQGAGAYKASSGLFGIGLKAAAGLSEFFRILTHRPDGTGSLVVKRGKHKMVPDLLMTPPADGTGVTVVYEPDSTILHLVDEYAKTGFVGIPDLLSRYTFFKYSNAVFLINENPLPKKFWDCSIDEADKIIDKVVATAATIWDAASFNAVDWIKTLWGITQKNWSWERSFVPTSVVPHNDRIGEAIIKLFYVRNMRGERMGLVNRISIDRADADHMSGTTNALVAAMAPLIDSKDIRLFFMNSYKLPIFMAVSVSYDDAEFIGTTKNNFRMPDFRIDYGNMMTDYFKTAEGKEIIESLYETIREDIRVRYEESLGAKTAVKLQGRITSRLNRPRMYRDCTSRDRSNCELFLVEGESANSATGDDIDTETQAIYAMGGKPINGITNRPGETRLEIISTLMKNKIYQDIFTLLNIDPRKPINMAELNFKRCLIASDADEHGNHIASIVVANFAAVCPELVEAGFFSVVVPPYYEVSVAGNKDNQKFEYIRDAAYLNEWCARRLIAPRFSVKVGSYDPRIPLVETNLQQLIDLHGYVFEVGEMLDNLSSELYTPAAVIENLCRCTGRLNKEHMDTEYVKESLGADMVRYDDINNILTVTYGGSDIPIPLTNVARRLRETILPVLHRVGWTIPPAEVRTTTRSVAQPNCIFYLTTLKTDLYKDSPMSTYMLYQVFKQARKLINLKPLKGLGAMEPEDAARTCINVNNRRVYSIKSLGDVNEIFRLLGDDSTPRKSLVAAPMSVSDAFLTPIHH